MKTELLTYAKWNFYAYGKEAGSELTRLEVWERVKEKTGKEMDGLNDKPYLNENLVYLWAIYIEIKTNCEKISFVDLYAYQRVTQNELTPWESLMILELEKLRNSDG